MEKECPICLESGTSNVLMFNCNHTLCVSCVDKWDGDCPMCRQSRKPFSSKKKYICFEQRVISGYDPRVISGYDPRVISGYDSEQTVRDVGRNLINLGRDLMSKIVIKVGTHRVDDHCEEWLRIYEEPVEDSKTEELVEDSKTE